MDDAIAANGRPVRENFEAWFGNSRVLRVNGLPLMLYHLTQAQFTSFDTDRGDLGSHFGTAQQVAAHRGSLMFDGFANQDRTVPVYLRIVNPIRLTHLGSFHADAVAPQLARRGLIGAFQAKALALVGDTGSVPERRAANQAIKALLEAAGHDGVVYSNAHEGKGNSFIVFRPEQVKGAVGNSGLYDSACRDFCDRHDDGMDLRLVQVAARRVAQRARNAVCEATLSSKRASP